MAPTTVPMKNGVSREENGEGRAGRALPGCSRVISLRKANPAPRSTIPARASHSGSASGGHHRGEGVRERGPEDDQVEDQPDVVGLPDRGDRLVDQRARGPAPPVAAGQQVPQAAAEVGPAQHRVQGDPGQQDARRPRRPPSRPPGPPEGRAAGRRGRRPPRASPRRQRRASIRRISDGRGAEHRVQDDDDAQAGDHAAVGGGRLRRWSAAGRPPRAGGPPR